MDIYKKDTALELELWNEYQKVKFAMTPMVPKPGTRYRKKDEFALVISFILHLNNTLTASFYLIEMSQNRNVSFNYKYVKPNKSLLSGSSVKSFTGSLCDNGILLTIEDEEQKQSIILNHAEAYAIAIWLQIAATGFVIGCLPAKNESSTA